MIDPCDAHDDQAPTKEQPPLTTDEPRHLHGVGHAVANESINECALEVNKEPTLTPAAATVLARIVRWHVDVAATMPIARNRMSA